jgi:hypothetical protein
VQNSEDALNPKVQLLNIREWNNHLHFVNRKNRVKIWNCLFKFEKTAILKKTSPKRQKSRKKNRKPPVPSSVIKLEGESSRSTIDIIRYKVVVNGEKMILDVHLLNQRFVECTASVKYLKKWEAIPEETRNEVKRRVKLYYAGE